MKPKTLRILIIGLALLIFGPVVGWVLSMAGVFHAATSVQQFQPGVMPDLEGTTSQMFYSLIPVLLGILLGAVGAFLFLYALLTHFFRAKPDA